MADNSTAEWEAEVQDLIAHGRDREAARLASRHLGNGSTSQNERQPMDALEQLDQIGPLLVGVAGGIKADQLDNPTACANFTVRGVLQHMLGGAGAFAAAFRGEPAPTSPPADGPDLPAQLPPALGGLVEAMRSPGAMDRTIAAPFGEVPAPDFARFVALDGLVHGWDLATATGQPYEPSDALVAEVSAFAEQAIGADMRDGDTFAEPATPPDDASPIERLVALTGRQVR